ncbi:MAG: ribbon-helix-helix protein, CopG family [Nitrososphaeria archaeon]
MRVVAFKLGEDLLQKLDLYAVNMRLSRSEVIREAIESYLTQFIIQEKSYKTIRTQEI